MPRPRSDSSRARAPRTARPPARASTLHSIAPLPRSARIAAILVAALALLALVSFPLTDPDLWEHLRVGRAIWETRSLPHVNLFTWPTYGAPYVVPSWLFRVALWPFAAAGGVAGIYVWRWLTTLVAFALLWAAARAGATRGATGLAAIFSLLWWALLYRYRSQARPETLVAVLLAAQLWLLQSRRALAARTASERLDRAWWAVPLTAVWVNVHLSYVLALVVTGAYALDDMWRRRREPPATRFRLVAVLLVSVAACFANPYGLALVRQPFDFALVERHEPIMRTIAELKPLPWGPYLPTGLPLLLVLGVALALWRWRRAGLDLAELAILAAFIPAGLQTQRFIGYTALALAPFLARDASEFWATRRWPGWVARPWPRLVLAALAAALLLAPGLSGPALRPAMRWRESGFPIAACDAIAAQGVRGRSFNLFSHGGYLLWRFWPERDRLPFMDVHQTGTSEDRAEYFPAMFDSATWVAFDRHHHFDWVLLGRLAATRTPLLDWLDADSTHWALTFVDDVAALYVRRDGVGAQAAARWRYRVLPGGRTRLALIADRMAHDPALRSAFVTELERSARESRWSAGTEQMLGSIAMVDGRPADALGHFDAARRMDPSYPLLHTRRGLALMGLAKPGEALEEFRAARRSEPPAAEAERLIGSAERALGNRDAARAAWRRALDLDPGISGVRDSIAALGAVR
jgi:hypothetical protein